MGCFLRELTLSHWITALSLGSEHAVGALCFACVNMAEDNRK